MKRYLLIVFSLLIFLGGCVSRSSFSISFDTFNIKMYDNKKTYEPSISKTDIVEIKILSEFIEYTEPGDTGFINSLFVVKTLIDSEKTIEEITESNTKQLQSKMLQYIQKEDKAKKVKCKKQYYSGYISTFSYQLDGETLYGGQYYLLDDLSLYMISFGTDDEEDIKAFVKSVKKIRCKK